MGPEEAALRASGRGAEASRPRSPTRRSGAESRANRPQWPRSTLAFCFIVAAALVATRIAIVDYSYFVPATLPPHDMSQGAAFFATNLHALRLSGDIAWWNPVGAFGYAQHYQSFLSPLAPTSGHPVFVLWAALIRTLGRAGISAPEYYQYLAITYVAFPLLAFAAFLWLCTSLFRSRAAAVLAAIVYAFSGIGLWNSAWFYFQEQLTLYFLLGAAVAALRRPSRPRMLVLLLAALTQIVSLNYWSLYNAWFLALVLGAYAAFHWNQVHRLARRLAAAWRRLPIGFAAPAVAASVTAAVWLALVAMVAREGAGYVRVQGVSEGGHFGIEGVSDRIQELRSFTTDFFNAAFGDAILKFPRINPMHSARYLGAELFPLLAAFAALRWGRRERWLVACAAGVLCVCLGPPFLLRAWAATPGMDRIQHFFYFYSHHLQVLVALAAAAGLDGALAQPPGRPRRGLVLAVAGGVAVSLLVLVELGVFSAAFPGRDFRLQGGLVFALATLVVGVPLLRQVTQPSAAHRRLLVGVLIALTFADLTRYFWIVERTDIAYTVSQRFGRPLPNPLPAAMRATLRRPWAAPDPAQEFDGGVAANLPVVNEFWPRNLYLMPRHLVELADAAGAPAFERRPALRYFPPGQARLARGGAAEVASPHAQLLLAADGRAAPVERASADTSRAGIEYRFRTWSYNGFTIDIRVPGDGWLLIAQNFDPAWRIRIDGRPVVPWRAEHTFMAVPVTATSRTLVMEYRPLARALYWPAALLLLATCAALALGCMAGRSRAPVSPEGRPV